MSLADELLADLEEIAEEGEDELPNNQENEEIEEIMEVDDQIVQTSDSVKNIAKLRDGNELTDTMRQIEIYEQNPRNDANGPPVVEADPEYQLIVKANNYTVEIENEINIIHKFTRDHYSKRFPELESLVPTPMEYLRTVKELGNNVDKAKNNEVLQEILTAAVIMIVSVSASTTQGQELEAQELARIEEACVMAEDLMQAKARILEYVESRMSFFAPNLSFIVGASTAAKLMGAAGGLTNLAKMPSCNIMLLGAQKKTLSGFSSIASNPHTGFIYYCPLAELAPLDIRKKAARLISGKCTLAARIDSFHQDTAGETGNNMRVEIVKKLDKWQEPPPVKQVKALPAPLDPARKKRGGRRLRKMKEKMGITDLRKQANRMTFATIEEDAYQEDLGFSAGHMGKRGSGRVRAAQVDSKTQVKISKSLQRKLQKAQAFGTTTSFGGKSTVKGGRETSGTASSVAFTPMQGIEIINPNAAEKRGSEANAKYFSASAGFLNVKKEEKS